MWSPTLQLVDTLKEQTSAGKTFWRRPSHPVPPECDGVHYLYTTPFRYGLYPNGSRFRRAGPTPGICCVSKEPKTAIIETAFHFLRFYADAPGTPFPISAERTYGVRCARQNENRHRPDGKAILRDQRTLDAPVRL
jgi:hypothetical protein